MSDTYLKKVSFLVVEDAAFMRTLIRRVLSALDVGEVRDANNGEDALQVLENYDPDIIIADWEMQPMDGLEFVKRVRGGDDESLSMLPIIMLSGHSEASRVATARDAGVNEFVVKPFSVNSLFSRIEEVIEWPRRFVKTDDFFGPDRRRKNLPHPNEERRKQDIEEAASPDDEAGASDAEAGGGEDGSGEDGSGEDGSGDAEA